MFSGRNRIARVESPTGFQHCSSFRKSRISTSAGLAVLNSLRTQRFLLLKSNDLRPSPKPTHCAFYPAATKTKNEIHHALHLRRLRGQPPARCRRPRSRLARQAAPYHSRRQESRPPRRQKRRRPGPPLVVALAGTRQARTVQGAMQAALP